jgi:hypothetical protein
MLAHGVAFTRAREHHAICSLAAPGVVNAKDVRVNAGLHAATRHNGGRFCWWRTAMQDVRRAGGRCPMRILEWRDQTSSVSWVGSTYRPSGFGFIDVVQGQELELQDSCANQDNVKGMFQALQTYELGSQHEPNERCEHHASKVKAPRIGYRAPVAGKRPKPDQAQAVKRQQEQ